MRRPVLLYDGDCGFCRLWIERWRQLTGPAVDYLSAQESRARFPKLKEEELDRAVHLIEPDGRVTRGAEAVYGALAHGGRGLWLRLYRSFPPFRAASERVYGAVAARRPLFSALTRLLWGRPELPPVDGTRRAVLAALGLVYVVAFASFAVQLPGLIGREGIMPAAGLLEAGSRLGLERFWHLPTLAWLASSDGALQAFCWLGALAGAGLIAGLRPGWCALAAWALYLSISVVGSEFMGFQWDALLLETGLIAVFLGARGGRPALLLLRLLLLKLMLESGLVKLLSGDPSWRDLSALDYHYWTQPLPNPPAWLVDQLPAWFDRASCLLMFAIELGACWLLLLPRRARVLGAGAIAALMLAIAVTGNYGFFNLLTLALCLSALDDRVPWLARLAPRKPEPEARSRALAAFACVWLAVSALSFSLRLGLRPPLPELWGGALALVSPLRSINNYGLFAVMTKSRDEISIEVSAGGDVWREWPFRWKPGDPRRMPPAPAPHMPRLDWQMWFAALGSAGENRWFGNLLYRLLQGSKDVEALMGPHPLGGAKPVYARAVLWKTRFTTAEERRADGAWWRRERKGLYFPVVSLKD